MLTCPLLNTHSGSFHVGGLGVHSDVVKSVRTQAIEAVAALRAPDGDLLSSALGGCGYIKTLLGCVIEKS